MIRTVSPGYFKTMGIPLESGHEFTAGDNTQSAPYWFVVSAAFTKKYFPHENPLGKRISAWMNKDNPFGQIIGVVGDVKEGALDKPPELTIYYVHAHLAYSRMVLVIRTKRNPLLYVAAVRRAIHKIDPLQPIAEAQTMEQIVGETYSRQTFSAVLLAGFSGAALLLAPIGSVQCAELFRRGTNTRDWGASGLGGGTGWYRPIISSHRLQDDTGRELRSA